jgi:hypothetical protein
MSERVTHLSVAREGGERERGHPRRRGRGRDSVSTIRRKAMPATRTRRPWTSIRRYSCTARSSTPWPARRAHRGAIRRLVIAKHEALTVTSGAHRASPPTAATAASWRFLSCGRHATGPTAADVTSRHNLKRTVSPPATSGAECRRSADARQLSHVYASHKKRRIHARKEMPAHQHLPSISTEEIAGKQG